MDIGILLADFKGFWCVLPFNALTFFQSTAIQYLGERSLGGIEEHLGMEPARLLRTPATGREDQSRAGRGQGATTCVALRAMVGAGCGRGAADKPRVPEPCLTSHGLGAAPPGKLRAGSGDA